MTFVAYVDNIGCIGTFSTKPEAIDAVKQTIELSGRADPHGYVMDQYGELTAEIGEPNDNA